MPEFDDKWYEDWKRGLEESGGNIILTLGLRPLEADEHHVVMEMPYGPNVRQGTEIAGRRAYPACGRGRDDGLLSRDGPGPKRAVDSIAALGPDQLKPAAKHGSGEGDR